jgi:plasmid stability protein
MAQVVLEDIDAAILERLQARATAHQRSVAVEIRAILEEACEQPIRPGLDEFLTLASGIRAHTATRPQTDSAILIREDRER